MPVQSLTCIFRFRPRRRSLATDDLATTPSNETIDETYIAAALNDSATDDGAFTLLVHKLGIAFSTVENIAGSFQAKEKAPLDHILARASQMKFNEGSKLTKEQLRALEDDQDKDEDSCAEKVQPVQELHKTKLDLNSLRRSFRQLLDIKDTGRRERVLDTLNSVLINVVECMTFDLQCTMSKEKVENILMASIVILDVFCMGECLVGFS